MKATMTDDNGILIMPETEFEVSFLEKHFSQLGKITAFVKCGLSPADVLGIKVISEKVKK